MSADWDEEDAVEAWRKLRSFAGQADNNARHRRALQRQRRTLIFEARCALLFNGFVHQNLFEPPSHAEPLRRPRLHARNRKAAADGTYLQQLQELSLDRDVAIVSTLEEHGVVVAMSSDTTTTSSMTTATATVTATSTATSPPLPPHSPPPLSPENSPRLEASDESPPTSSSSISLPTSQASSPSPPTSPAASAPPHATSPSIAAPSQHSPIVPLMSAMPQRPPPARHVSPHRRATTLVPKEQRASPGAAPLAAPLPSMRLPSPSLLPLPSLAPSQPREPLSLLPPPLLSMPAPPPPPPTSQAPEPPGPLSPRSLFVPASSPRDYHAAPSMVLLTSPQRSPQRSPAASPPPPPPAGAALSPASSRSASPSSSPRPQSPPFLTAPLPATFVTPPTSPREAAGSPGAAGWSTSLQQSPGTRWAAIPRRPVAVAPAATATTPPLGSPSDATSMLPTTATAANPIDTPQYFVLGSQRAAPLKPDATATTLSHSLGSSFDSEPVALLSVDERDPPSLYSSSPSQIESSDDSSFQRISRARAMAMGAPSQAQGSRTQPGSGVAATPQLKKSSSPTKPEASASPASSAIKLTPTARAHTIEAGSKARTSPDVASRLLQQQTGFSRRNEKKQPRKPLMHLFRRNDCNTELDFIRLERKLHRDLKRQPQLAHTILRSHVSKLLKLPQHPWAILVRRFFDDWNLQQKPQIRTILSETKARGEKAVRKRSHSASDALPRFMSLAIDDDAAESPSLPATPKRASCMLQKQQIRNSIMRQQAQQTTALAAEVSAGSSRTSHPLVELSDQGHFTIVGQSAPVGSSPDCNTIEQFWAELVQHITCVSNALEASILDRYEEWLYPVKGRTLNCLSHAIEEALFFPIHAELLLLYRLLHGDEALRQAAHAALLGSPQPVHFGISRQYWLSEGVNTTRRPYEAVVEKLREATKQVTPTAIAKCIKKAGRAVYTSIEEYYRNKHNAPPPKKELVMQTDVLIPIMAFAVRQTNMASLFIKTQLASDFLPQRHTFGEYGYFLATLQACFVFIMCLEKDDLIRSANDLMESQRRSRKLSYRLA